MQSLNGKTALVTGASSGIGLACARILAQDGARVVIMGRGEQALVRARAELATNLPEARIEIFVGDACQEDQVQAALAFAHGLATRLDILVPTVGGSEFKPLLLEDLAGVHRNIDMNFTNVFLIARHGVPLMQRGGTIVCISTAAVKRAFWGLSSNAAAKAALERFVRAAAFELGGAGIRINAVRPGMTASQATAEMRDMAGLVEHFAAETPLGRIGQPEDIARAVRFLAGPESGWVTGQTFSADGGQDQGKAPNLMDELFGKEVIDQVRAGKSVGPFSGLPSVISASLAAPSTSPVAG